MFYLKKILIDNMTMKLKNKPNETPPSVIQKVTKLFEKHIDTTGAMLDDYVIGNDGMFTELAAADEDFKDAIEELECEGEFDELVKKIEEIKDGQNYRELDEAQCEELIKLINDDFLIDYIDSKLSEDGYVKIKIEGLNDQLKLEAFIHKEIYPYNLNYGTGIDF